MGREPAYLSSHATNRYFIPNWGIILLLIEWIFISHKKCSINATVFVGYSFPLYYLMIYKGTGGAAFTWWFYLVLFTSIHVIILLIIFFHFLELLRGDEQMKENNVVTSETKDALSFGSLSHTATSFSHPCNRASCRWSTSAHLPPA